MSGRRDRVKFWQGYAVCLAIDQAMEVIRYLFPPFDVRGFAFHAGLLGISLALIYEWRRRLGEMP